VVGAGKEGEWVLPRASRPPPQLPLRGVSLVLTPVAAIARVREMLERRHVMSSGYFSSNLCVVCARWAPTWL